MLYLLTNLKERALKLIILQQLDQLSPDLVTGSQARSGTRVLMQDLLKKPLLYYSFAFLKKEVPNSSTAPKPGTAS